MNYFQGSKDHPQHLSVGAILMNAKGEICCHHIFAKDLEGHAGLEGLDDFYILMRETIEMGEGLEDAVHRGLQEEFGATAEIVDYVGSIKGSFLYANTGIEKTTLYFLCKLIDQDETRRTGDIESKTTLEWQTPAFLIPRMQEQSQRLGRTDIDESLVLKRIEIR